MFNVKKKVGYFIISIFVLSVIVIVIAIGAYFNSYNEKVKQAYSKYNEKILQHLETQKENNINDYVGFKKINAQQWMTKTLVNFEEKYQDSKIKIKEDLQESINFAINDIKKVKKTKNKNKTIQDVKYILSKLNKKLKSTDLFLVNYNGDTLYGRNSDQDINARTIVLEEIQNVRRRGTGYIVSTVDILGTKRHILVQDLGIHELFIGVNLYEKSNNIELKNSILEGMENVLLDPYECLVIYEGKRKVYDSSSCSIDEVNNKFIQDEFKPFDWKLVYHFDNSELIKKETQKVEKFKSVLQENLF